MHAFGDHELRVPGEQSLQGGRAEEKEEKGYVRNSAPSCRNTSMQTGQGAR